MRIEQLVVVAVVAVVAACGGENKQDSATGSAAGSSAKATDPSGPKGTPDKPAGSAVDGKPGAGATSGEYVHKGDRSQMQGFLGRKLAVGGGYVYFVEQLRIDKNGLDKTTIRRKQTSDIAAAPEDFVAQPVFGIDADDTAVYFITKTGVASKPHAGGDIKELAKGGAGKWFEVYAGDKHLLVRGARHMALVPKAGGEPQPMYDGQRGAHMIANDGDRFYVIDVSNEQQKAPTRKIEIYEPGQKPKPFVEAAELRAYPGVWGDHVYFTGEVDMKINILPGKPLWRVPKAGGKPEAVGDPSVGFADYVIRNGTIYGSIFKGKWYVQKLKIGDTAPAMLDDLSDFKATPSAMDADDKHLYWTTDWNVKRAAL